MRKSAACFAVVALAACGFTPVYGPNGAGGEFRGAIEIAEPDTDEEFAFVGRIEERLGRSSTGPLFLSFELVTEEVELAIDGSNAITRFNIEGRLDWTLSEADTVVDLGEETAFTAYSATGSTISTLESERDARRRLMVILADKVVAQLLTP